MCVGAGRNWTHAVQVRVTSGPFRSILHQGSWWRGWRVRRPSRAVDTCRQQQWGHRRGANRVDSHRPASLRGGRHSRPLCARRPNQGRPLVGPILREALACLGTSRIPDSFPGPASAVRAEAWPWQGRGARIRWRSVHPPISHHGDGPSAHQPPRRLAAGRVRPPSLLWPGAVRSNRPESGPGKHRARPRPGGPCGPSIRQPGRWVPRTRPPRRPPASRTRTGAARRGGPGSDRRPRCTQPVPSVIEARIIS